MILSLLLYNFVMVSLWSVLVTLQCVLVPVGSDLVTAPTQFIYIVPVTKLKSKSIIE